MKQTLVFFFVLSCFSAYSQQPSYFKIGEDELSGVHVYDIIQDQNLNYIIATNNGIYKYDYYDFIKIDCPEMSSSSVFNLVESKDGKLYCNNLSGQIFEISNYACELYYQIPDSLMYHEIGLNFNDNNQLTVLTSCLFVINSNKTAEKIFSIEGSTFYGDLTSNDQGGLYFYCNSEQDVYKYEKGDVILQHGFTDKLRPWTINVKGELLIFDQSNGKLAYPENYSDYTKNNEALTGPIIYTDGSNVWKALRTGGAKIYSGELIPLFNQDIVFQNYFLSAMTVDQEGNILLGTFGDGILVVPNLKTEEFKIKTSNEGIVKVKAIPNGKFVSRLP